MDGLSEPPLEVLLVDGGETADETARGVEAAHDSLTVRTVPDSTTGLDRIRNEGVDCAVVGAHLPETSQAEFLERLRESHPDVPVVVLVDPDRERPVDEHLGDASTDYFRRADGVDPELLARRVLEVVDRRRKERRFVRQTDLFEKVQRLAGVGGWEYDLDSDSIRWTDGVRRIHGVTEDYEPTIEEAMEFYHPEDRNRVRDTIDSVIEGGGQYDLEARIRTADGETRWVRTRGELQSDEGQRLRGSIQDITEDRRDRKRLRQHKATIEALHRAAADIAAANSRQAVAELTVEAAKELLEFTICSVLYHEDGWLEPVAVSEESPEEGVRRVPVDEGEGGLAGKTYREGRSFVVDEVSSDDHSDPAKSSYRSGISVPIGDHGVFQAVATETEAFDERDVELAELLLAHSNSALGNLDKENALRERNERLDQFARVVSHDLRNPLEAARGYVELARRTGDTTNLDGIDQSLDRMDVIIDDALSLARGSEGSTSSTVELEELATRSWSSVQTGDATLSVEDSRPVRVNPDRVERLFENLFRNSVEHGSTGDRPVRADEGDEGPAGITVRVGTLPDGFYVEDDGRGIPEGMRDEVFGKGVSTVDGTGLGLSIVEQVASAHGWSVELAEGDEAGARFEFRGVSPD